MTDRSDPRNEPGTGRGSGLVAGVDGCRGRWLVVTGPCRSSATSPSVGLQARLVDDLDELVGAVRAGRIEVACIDMPIGLLDAGPRAADREARALLGERRSTVFPAPVRAVLGAVDYDDARRRSRAAHGKALSIQTYNLLGPIAHLDALLGPDDTAIVEAHPELAFARLDDDRPLPSKKTPEGRQQRLALLARALGPLFEQLIEVASSDRLPIEDLLDATALVLTARHVVAGTHRRLGGDELDATGKRPQVVW